MAVSLLDFNGQTKPTLHLKCAFKYGCSEPCEMKPIYFAKA